MPITNTELILGGAVAYLLYRTFGASPAAGLSPQRAQPRPAMPGSKANSGGPDLDVGPWDWSPKWDANPDAAILREGESITAPVPPENAVYAAKVNAAIDLPSFHFAAPDTAATPEVQAAAGARALKTWGLFKG